MKGQVRNIFPGGNTSEGFYSYYGDLLAKGWQKLYVLKGGPGVGKSSLMKKIGAKMTELGYDAEYYYCSSDSDSLDGLHIVGEGIVMVDGTSPHMIDPRYPGAAGETVNLGEYLKQEMLEKERAQIIASTKAVSGHFERAYRFFGAACLIAQNIETIHHKCMDWQVVNELTSTLRKSFLDKTDSTMAEDRKPRPGRIEHYFGSAYTPAGYVDHTASILEGMQRIYYVAGDIGTGKSVLMRKIAEGAREKGLYAEVYHTPLIPQKVQTVLLPELKLALTASPQGQEKSLSTIDMRMLLNQEKRIPYEEELAQDKKLLERLLELGIVCIAAAKKEHDKLEAYYIPHMDFERVDQKYEQILKEILEKLSRKTVMVGTMEKKQKKGDPWRRL